MGNTLLKSYTNDQLKEEKWEELNESKKYTPQISADDSMIKSENKTLYVVLFNKEPVGYFKELHSKIENKNMIETFKDTLRMKYDFDFSKQYFIEMKYSIETDYYKIIVSSKERNCFTSYEKIEDVIEVYPVDNLNF